MRGAYQLIRYPMTIITRQRLCSHNNSSCRSNYEVLLIAHFLTNIVVLSVILVFIKFFLSPFFGMYLGFLLGNPCFSILSLSQDQCIFSTKLANFWTRILKLYCPMCNIVHFWSLHSLETIFPLDVDMRACHVCVCVCVRFSSPVADSEEDTHTHTHTQRGINDSYTTIDARISQKVC